MMSAPIDQRPVATDDAWMDDAPPFDRWLPGGRITIKIQPAPRWPLQVRNARLLHGAVSQILGASGVGHDSRVPVFSLAPHGPTWSLVTTLPEVVAVLAGGHHVSAIARQRCILSFGHVERVAAPIVAPGPRRLVVRAVTPVVLRRARSGGEKANHPTPDTLACAIGPQFAERFGLPPLRKRIELPHGDVSIERVPHGGKFGDAWGWVGWIEVLCNAPAAFLLRLAETHGLGARVALGCGRIEVGR